MLRLREPRAASLGCGVQMCPRHGGARLGSTALPCLAVTPAQSRTTPCRTTPRRASSSSPSPGAGTTGSRWDHWISLAGTTGSLSLGRRHGHDTITLPPEAFGGFDSFSLHIASATAVFHLQPAPLGSAGPSPGSGELVCQGSGRTPRLLPSLPGRFQAPSSALVLVSRNLFGERLPGCTSVPSVQKDSTSELSTSQENQRRGSDLSGEDKEEEQAGAPWRRALRSGARMHCV